MERLYVMWMRTVSASEAHSRRLVTSVPTGQVSDLTCCRAFFAAGVFSYHVNLQNQYAPLLGRAGSLVRHGFLGVDAFFILSGLVLAYVHPTLMPRPGEVRQFLSKRLARIYPVHLAIIALFLALLAVSAAAGLHPREPGRFGLGELVKHLLLVQAWGFSHRWAWNYPSWSISAEWGGYLGFPLIWPLVRKLNVPSLLLALAAMTLCLGLAERLAAVQGLSLTYDGGLLRLYPEFVSGMIAVALVARLPIRIDGTLFVAGGVVIGLLGLWHDAELVVVAGLWLLLFGFLLRHRQERRPLLDRMPGLRWLGEISYAYYMSFALVETFQASLWRMLHRVPTEQKLLYGVTTTILTFILAVAMVRLVEQPALRAFSRRAKARRLARSNVSA